MQSTRESRASNLIHPCRKVAIPVLNDSPYIGMNVYNVVLTSIVVVSCQSLLSERTTLAFVVVATLIWTSTTTALCLLFIPKVAIFDSKLGIGAVVNFMAPSIAMSNRRRHDLCVIFTDAPSMWFVAILTDINLVHSLELSLVFYDGFLSEIWLVVSDKYWRHLAVLYEIVSRMKLVTET